MIFVKEKFGAVLNTRDLGAKFRNLIINELDKNGEVILDFEGVRSLSQSFADESLAKLAEKIGFEDFKAEVKMINLNDDNVSVIKYVITQRIKKDKTVV